MSSEPGADERGEKLLPVHGFVLAGGKSSRMGRDKALLEFRGRPMVEIAVAKLREFCADVSIAGNRSDLSGFAEVVPEERLDAGPAAGIEAGLKAARQEWALFVPVDVPLVPAELLRSWAWTCSGARGLMASCLYTNESRQPSFCMLRRETLSSVRGGLDRDVRRLESLFDGVRSEFGGASMLRMPAESFVARGLEPMVEVWFANLNAPEDLLQAEGGSVEG